ncbi:DNA polymerase IV [Candidatus Roizmanbacteria bacterium]|nr:DNA polymerase IV [Candidatus Roizmanbacteria bacterium]
MFQLHSWSNVILHLDGDAFFSSVFQAVNPNLKGKPVVTGSERGLATAVSYEARKYGIKRGMLTWQIKKICPQCIILESDYELYSLFSHKMFQILRTFTPVVEEYSIDEGFGDIKGLRQPLNMSYGQIGQAIKNKIESSLGISISVGISLTKSLAKLASSSQKPSGLTVVDGRSIEKLLVKTKIKDVWGIGQNTSAYLEKFGIKTALDFALRSEIFVQTNLIRPFYEIWKELRGEKVYELDIQGKQSYKGITRSQTFTPSTNNKDILWAKLSTHIEDAFAQARKFHYLVGKISPFLKTQNFEYHTSEIKLKEKVAYPYLIHKQLRQIFDLIHKKGIMYRSTGCHISDFQENTMSQMTLFERDQKLEEKMKKIYPLYEKKKIDFGSMLFDKQRYENKNKPKLKIPLLTLN